MIDAVPKWVWRRYALLWKKFDSKAFTFDQAVKELQHLNKNTISVLFNELKTAGWVKVGLNENDTRMRTYTLINPVQLVEGIKK